MSAICDECGSELDYDLNCPVCVVIAATDKAAAERLLNRLQQQIADFQHAGDQHLAEKFIHMRAVDYLEMIIEEE